MNPPNDSRQRGPMLWVLLLLLVIVLIGVGGYLLWQRFNPFVNSEQAVQESNELRDTARRGPLTDAQFNRLLELSGPSRQPIVSYSVIATLELEAVRTPARAEQARQALQNLADHPDASVRTAAKTALSRLNQPAPMN